MQFVDYFAMKSLAPGMTSAIINRLGGLLTVLLGADYNLPLVDTFVVRTITVPATAALVGRANWWPSRPEQTRNPLGARAPRGSCVCSANRG